MSNLFLSYARQDSHFALRLAADLENLKHQIWVDSINLTGGEEWYDELERAIREADIFIAIITPSSTHSKWCKRDWLFADKLQKIIIPILLEGDIPYFFISTQIIYFRNENYENNLKKLLEILKSFETEGDIPSDGISPIDAGIKAVFPYFPEQLYKESLQQSRHEVRLVQFEGRLISIFEDIFLTNYSTIENPILPDIKILLPTPTASFINDNGLSEKIRLNLLKLLNLSSWPHLQKYIQVRLYETIPPFMLATADKNTLMAYNSTISELEIPYSQIEGNDTLLGRFVEREFSRFWEQATSLEDSTRPHVFVFYQRTDQDFAQFVVNELRERGFEAYYDQNFHINVDPWSTISNEIEKCDVIVTIVGDKTAYSEWVKQELEYAFALNKPIIPIFRTNTNSYEQNPSNEAFAQLLVQQGVRTAGNSFFNAMIDELGEQLVEQFLKPTIRKLPSNIIERLKSISGLNSSENGKVEQLDVKQTTVETNINIPTINNRTEAVYTYSSKIYDVFISYSHDDKDIMTRISNDLRLNKFMVWTDEQLTVGLESWRDAIEKAIENSFSVIVLMSKESKLSKWVKKEIYYAAVQEVKLFPILVKDIVKDAVPYELIDYQWADGRSEFDEKYTGEKKYMTELEALMQTIRHHKSTFSMPSSNLTE